MIDLPPAQYARSVIFKSDPCGYCGAAAPTPFVQIENTYMFRKVCGLATSNASHASRSVSDPRLGSAGETVR